MLLTSPFTRVNVFLCIVYLVEDGGTSAELHIMNTYLFVSECDTRGAVVKGSVGRTTDVDQEEPSDLERCFARGSAAEGIALLPRPSTPHEVMGTRSRPGSRLDEFLSDGVAGGGTARGDPDLAVDRGDMRIDGARADHQVLGDLRVGPALGQQA